MRFEYLMSELVDNTFLKVAFLVKDGIIIKDFGRNGLSNEIGEGFINFLQKIIRNKQSMNIDCRITFNNFNVSENSGLTTVLMKRT